MFDWKIHSINKYSLMFNISLPRFGAPHSAFYCISHNYYLCRNMIDVFLPCTIWNYVKHGNTYIVILCLKWWHCVGRKCFYFKHLYIYIYILISIFQFNCGLFLNYNKEILLWRLLFFRWDIDIWQCSDNFLNSYLTAKDVLHLIKNLLIQYWF